MSLSKRQTIVCVLFSVYDTNRGIKVVSSVEGNFDVDDFSKISNVIVGMSLVDATSYLLTHDNYDFNYQGALDTGTHVYKSL